MKLADPIVESRAELERYAREATVLLDLPDCRFCNRKAVVRISEFFQTCGGCALYHFGSTYMAGWS